MPTRSVMPAWRQRKFAITRKGVLEAEMIWESEMLMPVEPVASKWTNKPPGSPVSIATALDVEIKPLDLPGAWLVVGKGGKPLKNSKMYDEPEQKKKKKNKSRKVYAEAEPILAILSEEPSSSKCFQALHQSTKQCNKKVTRSQESKYWTGYQHAKQLKQDALDTLIAIMAAEAAITDDQDVDSAQRTVPTMPTKDNKANTLKDKSRRRARSAAVSARCYMFDDEDDARDIVEYAPKEHTRPRLRLSSDGALPEVKLPGAWTIIGKGGKPLSDFPPLKSRHKDTAKHERALTKQELESGKKSRKVSAEEPQLRSATNDKKAKSKCSVQ